MSKVPDTSPEIISQALVLTQSDMQRAMAKIGIDQSLLARKLQEELDANETKTFCNKGEIVDSKPKIAWDIRQRARQDAHKLMGHYPSDRHIHSFEGSLPIRQLTPEEELEVQAKMEVLRRKKSVRDDINDADSNPILDKDLPHPIEE